MARPDIPSLTGLRLIAAFLIVVFHGVPVILRLPPDWLHTAAGKCAPIGMTLFFVLSGFIIHYNYAASVTACTSEGLRKFFVARISRLYPMFLLLLVIDLIAGNFFITGTPDQIATYLGALPYFLTMTQTWFYGYIGNAPLAFPYHFAHVTWSISTEMFLYLVYPAMAWAIVRLRCPSSIAAAMLVAILLSAASKYGLASHPQAVNEAAQALLGVVPNPQGSPLIRFSDWLLYHSPYGRILEFLAGAFIAQLIMVDSIRQHDRAFHIAGWLAVPLLLFVFKRQTPMVWVHALAVPISCALIITACRQNSWYTRSLSSYWMVTLGAASYSIYLLHLIVIEKFAGPYGVPISEMGWHILLARFALICAMIALISMATYQAVERPAQNWLRAVLNARKPEPARVH